MNTFAAVCSAYESAARASVYLINADPGPVAAVAGAHTELRKLVADGDGDLADVAEIVRHARYRLATNIMPGTDPNVGLRNLRDQLVSASAQFHAGTPAHTATCRVLEAFEELLELDVTPLASEVIGVLSTSDPASRAVIVCHGRIVDSTDRYLRDSGAPSMCLSRSEMRKLGDFETLVLVGPHQFFPKAVWNAAKADSVCFVQYPLGNPPAPTGGLFGDQGGLTTPKFRTSGATGASGIAPMVANEGLVAAAARTGQRYAARSADIEVEADLLLLEGGYAVWTALGEGSWMWTVDLSDEHAPTVAQLRSRNVAPGHCVIFRDDGAGSSLVRSVADSEHGAARYRALQEEWKQALRAAVVRVGGVRAAERAIRDSGAQSANVRHWVTAESIRPNRRSDFTAACRFAQIADRDGQLWNALTEINRAHLRAGQTIRKRMEQALIADGGEQLRRDGIQRLEIEGFGRLSAYEVRHVLGKPQPIDADLIDEPFLAEERGWQG